MSPESAAKTAAKIAAKVAAKTAKAAAPTLADTPHPEDLFYISATQSASRPRRSLKHNDTFIVLDNFGDMAQPPEAVTECSTATPGFCRGCSFW